MSENFERTYLWTIYRRLLWFHLTAFFAQYFGFHIGWFPLLETLIFHFDGTSFLLVLPIHSIPT